MKDERLKDAEWRERHGFDNIAKGPFWSTPSLREVALEDLPAGARGWAMRILIKAVRR